MNSVTTGHKKPKRAESKGISSKRENYRDRKSQITDIKAKDLLVSSKVLKKYPELGLRDLELLFIGVYWSRKKGGYFTKNELIEDSGLHTETIGDSLNLMLDTGIIEHFKPPRPYYLHEYCLSFKGNLIVKLYNRIMINGLETGQFQYMPG